MKRNGHRTSSPEHNLPESASAGARGARSLDILIHTDGVDLTDKLREAVCRKLGRVRCHAPGALRARVQLHRVTVKPCAGQFRAHVLYEAKGHELSAEHSARDPVAALGVAAGKIKRRLRKRKTAYLARRLRLSSLR